MNPPKEQSQLYQVIGDRLMPQPMVECPTHEMLKEWQAKMGYMKAVKKHNQLFYAYNDEMTRIAQLPTYHQKGFEDKQFVREGEFEVVRQCLAAGVWRDFKYPEYWDLFYDDERRLVAIPKPSQEETKTKHFISKDRYGSEYLTSFGSNAPVSLSETKEAASELETICLLKNRICEAAEVLKRTEFKKGDKVRVISYEKLGTEFKWAYQIFEGVVIRDKTDRRPLDGYPYSVKVDGISRTEFNTYHIEPLKNK